MQSFPPSMDPVIGAIGKSAAVSFVRVYGGTRVYIPTTEQLGDEHPLCDLLGRPLAEKLSRELGGDYVAVPRVVGIEKIARDRVVVERVQAGESYATIARDLQLTERTIQGIMDRERGAKA